MILQILLLLNKFYTGISKLFCRQAAGAIVVTDITKEESLEDAVDWKHQVDQYATKDG